MVIKGWSPKKLYFFRASIQKAIKSNLQDHLSNLIGAVINRNFDNNDAKKLANHLQPK